LTLLLAALHSMANMMFLASILLLAPMLLLASLLFVRFLLWLASCWHSYCCWRPAGTPFVSGVPNSFWWWGPFLLFHFSSVLTFPKTKIDYFRT
jgi:hypothetical protein